MIIIATRKVMHKPLYQDIYYYNTPKLLQTWRQQIM